MAQVCTAKDRSREPKTEACTQTRLGTWSCHMSTWAATAWIARLAHSAPSVAGVHAMPQARRGPHVGAAAQGMHHLWALQKSESAGFARHHCDGSFDFRQVLPCVVFHQVLDQCGFAHPWRPLHQDHKRRRLLGRAVHYWDCKARAHQSHHCMYRPVTCCAFSSWTLFVWVPINCVLRSGIVI